MHLVQLSSKKQENPKSLSDEFIFSDIKRGKTQTVGEPIYIIVNHHP